MKTRKAPDGTTLRFPTDMPDAEIDKIIRREYPGEFRILSAPQPKGALARGAEELYSDLTGLAKMGGEFISRSGRYEPLKDKSGKPIREINTDSLDLIEFAPGTSLKQRMKISAAVWAESSPEARAKAIAKNLPEGFQVQITPRDDVVMTDPKGNQAVLNARGLTYNDAREVLMEAAKFASFGKFLGSAKTIPGMALRAAGATAALRGAEQTAGIVSGARDQIDPGEIASQSVIAGGLTILTAGTIRAAKKLIQRGRFVDGRGQFSKQANALFNKAGINPDDLSPDQRLDIARAIRKASRPEEAQRYIENRYLGVKPSAADIRQTPHLYERQRQAVKATDLDDPEAEVIRGLKLETQPQQLSDARQQVARKITGGDLADDLGANAGVARDAMSAKAANSLKAIDDAYTAARAHDVRIDASSVRRGLARRLIKVANDYDSPEIRSAIKPLVQALRNKKATAVSLKSLEQIRTRLVKSGANGSGEARRVYDDFMNGADDAVVKGNPQGIKAFKAARKMRAEHGRLYNDDPTIEAGLATRRGEDGRTFALSPEDWASKIFNKNGSLRPRADVTLEKAREILGPNSPEFAALKREALGRIIRVPDLEQGRNPLASFTSWKRKIEDFVSQNPTAARKLFTESDLNELGILGRVAQRTSTVAPDNLQNFSGTADATMRAANLARAPGVKQGVDLAVKAGRAARGPDALFSGPPVNGMVRGAHGLIGSRYYEPPIVSVIQSLMANPQTSVATQQPK